MSGVPHNLVVEGRLLPAPAGTCPQCAVEHEPEMPHDAGSLYYQYFYYHNHMAWPNWGDAMAHCEYPIQAYWREALRERGIVEERLWGQGQLPPGDPS